MITIVTIVTIITITTDKKQCDAGYYCMSRASIPNPSDNVTGVECPAGSYCLQGAITPTPCPQGTVLKVSSSKDSTDIILLFSNFLNISFWSTEILKSSHQEHTVTPREVWKRVIAPTVKADTITLTRAKRKNKSSSDFFVLILLFSILLLVIRTKLLEKSQFWKRCDSLSSQRV